MNMQTNGAQFQNATSAAYVLSSKAMLASLTITQWTARKLDKRVTASTNAAHGAASNAGNYNKALIAGDALAKIVTASNAARSAHYQWTLPWLDDGARILPAAAYFDYVKAMRSCREAFEAAVTEFTANYDQYCDDAKRRLGDMWQESDYPAASEIARKFSFGLRQCQVPTSDDFRVQIAESEAEAIRAEMEIQNKSALDGAMKDAWERIADTIGHMSKKLSEFKPATDGSKSSGIFRDSLVDNVKALARVLPALNIAGDARLDAVASRIESELCRYGADELRESDLIRDKVQSVAADIVAQVSEFI